jgi:hypothetical protein
MLGAFLDPGKRGKSTLPDAEKTAKSWFMWVKRGMLPESGI